MKIIIPNIEVPILHNVAQCLESIKAQASLEPLFWNVAHKPILDLFDETHPEILFLHISQLDTAFSMVCQEFKFKYILVGDHLPENLPLQPHALLTSPQLANTIKNCNAIGIGSAAKVAQIHNAQYRDMLSSDILINTTNVEITSQIFDLLSFLTEEYNTKIVGDSSVKLHHYLGQVNMFERADFIKSSKVLLDLNGEDAWDASYLKIPSLCTNLIADHFLTFNNISSLKLQLEKLLKDEDSRQEYIDICYKAVCNGNTYYHVATQIFHHLKEKQIAEHLSHCIEELSS